MPIELPPLEHREPPLILHWWFLAIIFSFVFIIASFAILVIRNYQTLHSGNVNAIAQLQLTVDPTVQARNVESANVLTADDPSLGPVDAPVTIVEFGDFECPFCLESFPVIREVMTKYGDRVRFQWRDFPVSSQHTHALDAALAGECVAEQSVEKFWAFHDQVFINQSDLSRDALARYATQIGADMNAFTACMEAGSLLDEISQDYNAGVEAGVTGTPTFFINNRRVPGAVPFSVFEDIIELTQ